MYKYLDENGIALLEKGTIKFSTPRSFNDPFELRPVIEKINSDEELEAQFEREWEKVIKQEYDKLPEKVRSIISFENMRDQSIEIKPSLIEQARRDQKIAAKLLEGKAHSVLDETVGILCLTENKNNHLMWAHYANSHKGFLVEFDCRHDFFDKRKSDNDSFRKLVKIKYKEQRERYFLASLKEEGIYTVKDIAWEYEKEWRMLVALQDAEHKKPEVDLYLFSIPFAAIKRVIIGANAEKELEERIIKACGKNLPHATVYKAEVDQKEYKINYVQVEI